MHIYSQDSTCTRMNEYLFNYTQYLILVAMKHNQI